MVRFALQSWHVTLGRALAGTTGLLLVLAVAPDEDVLGLASSQHNLRHEPDTPFGLGMTVIACAV